MALFFGVFLILFSCQKEDEYVDLNKNNDPVIQNLKEWVGSKNLQFKNQILWNNAEFKHSSSSPSYLVTIPVKDNNNKIIKRLLIVVKNQSYSGEVFIFNSKNELSNFSASYAVSTHDLTKEFTGTLEMIDINDDSKKTVAFIDGNVVLDKTVGYMFDGGDFGPACMPCHGGGDIDYFLDDVVVTGGGNDDWVEFPDDYPTGAPIIIDNNNNSAENFEDQIDDSNMKPCLKAILNNLKNVTSGVGSIVTTFAGNTPGYNWEVKDGTLSGQTASTDPPANYNSTTGTITTTFDSQAWLNATDLSWARTMLHESVHAYLSSYYKINRPNWIATYPQMVQDWATLQNWNDVQHEEISRSLINPIATALEDYGISQGYNLGQQFYEDMAWGGLQGTNVFNSLSQADKSRILDTIATELTGKDTNNNNKTQKGQNAGC